MLPAPAARLALISLGSIPLVLALAGHAQAAPTAPPHGGNAASVPALPDPPLLAMEEVSVTATRTERNVLEVPGNVTVLDREAIESSGARDVVDLLRRQSGLFVVRRTINPEQTTVEARGFNNGSEGGSATLVLVDGRRMNLPDSTSPDWGQFPTLDDIERIEVTRGPSSALYGDNAQAAVIQIFTRAPEGRPRAVLNGQSGTFDTDGGSVWLGGSEGPVGASVFLEGFWTDGYRDSEDYRSREARGRLHFDLAEGIQLELLGGYARQRRRRPGALDPMRVEDDRNGAQNPGARDLVDVRERWIQGRLSWTVSEQVSVQLQSWYRRRNDRGGFSASSFDFDNEGKAWQVDAQIEGTHEVLGRTLRSIAGAEVLQEDRDSDTSFGGNDGRRKTYALFLQNELALLEDLFLSFGTRYDHLRFRDPLAGGRPEGVREKATNWSPNVALTWRFAEPASVYASYERGFRFPNPDEFAGFLGFQPPLDPQKSDSYEIGLKVRARELSLNLALYHIRVEDEIVYIADPLFVSVNLPRVEHRGIELSANLRPWDWLEVYGSYTYDDTTIKKARVKSLEGNQLPITSSHYGTVGMQVQLPLGFEIGGNANYVGSRRAANDFLNDVDKLSQYATYDARVAWRHGFSEHLELLVEANGYNLTDRDYTEFRSLPTFGFGPVGEYPAAGRNYLVSAQLTLRR